MEHTQGLQNQNNMVSTVSSDKAAAEPTAQTNVETSPDGCARQTNTSVAGKARSTVAKLIRVLTVAPFMAAFMLTLLLIFKPSVYNSIWHYAYAMGCLAVFPLLAYPVAAIIPPLKRKGRDGQRNLAIVFSVVGYIAGLTGCFLMGADKAEMLIFWTYLLSGVLIALSSFVFGVKASGHACGVSGPIAMLIYCLGLPYCILYALLGVVFWSSVKMKRHTPAQLIIGSIIPVLTMLISMGILKMF